MLDITYTTVPNRLKSFLERMTTDGVPQKLTTKTLEERGFRSSNDRSLIRVIKALGFADDSGTPTANWRLYKDRQTNRTLLAGLLRATYSDLFQTYPDAQNRTDKELENYMGSRT